MKAGQRDYPPQAKAVLAKWSSGVAALCIKMFLLLIFTMVFQSKILLCCYF